MALMPAARQFGPRVGGAAVAAIVILAHFPAFFHQLLDGDEAIYGSIAALMNLGGRLYADGGVDNKPPGIFWVYAATFHLAGNYQMTVIHAVALIVTLATGWLLFSIGRSLYGVRAGLLAALIYGILTAVGNPRLLAANTEIFMMLPLTASFLLMLRHRWLWAGALLVAAGAFRQVAAINLLLVPVAVVLMEPPPKRLHALALFGGGLAGALLGGAALLAATGSLPGFWAWSIQTLYGYAALNWTPALVWMRAWDSVLPFVLTAVVVWVAAIAFAWRWKTLPPGAQLIVAWLAISIPGSFAGGHLSWHYFIQVMGPLALLAGFAFDRALNTSHRRLVTVVAIAGLALPMAGWWAFDVVADPLTYDFKAPPPAHETVASYIRSHTRPQDRVFVWGDWPALYVESDRIMAARFPGFLRGFARGSALPPNNWDTSAAVWPALQEDLTRHPPALILDTSASANWSDFSKYPMSHYPVLARFVAAGYHLTATVNGVAVYAPNGS
ncbi:MAG TPA: glycosyltransferase family 39 protein [Candidatus Dormibacteraeota bacterium]